MKTLTKFFLLAALGGSFSVAAIAGPGPQYWNRSTSSPAVKAAAPANDGSVLACEHMLVRNTGSGSDRVPWVSVSCSSEMLRTNEGCRSQCGVAAAVKPEPTKLTCAHMLTRTTGPGSSRVALKGVICTPEMMASNPECQSACRS